MKNGIFLFAVAIALSAVADVPSVEITGCRQRWPWEACVDVDFTLDAPSACDIKFAFTYDGADGPTTITNAFADMTVYGVEPGAGHFTWDPADYGLADKALVNLQVSATEIATVEDRTFLVLDLTSGDYSFLAARPANGWTNTTYMANNMVFRRVRAGDYTVGHTDDEIALVKGSAATAAEKRSIGQRSVRLSSDYYIAIFPLTSYQHDKICGTTVRLYKAHTMTFDACRGQTNADESVNINWPITGLGRFGADSFLQKVRNLSRGRLMIDLPTETQWEVAMRAGTTTILPNGGVADGTTTQQDIKDLWLELSRDNNSENVGLRKPNAWDIYNPVGMHHYWCLDAFPFYNTANGWEDNRTTGQSGRDPYGNTIAAGQSMTRVCRGTGYADGAGAATELVGSRRTSVTSTNPNGSVNSCAVRLATHLSDPRK